MSAADEGDDRGPWTRSPGSCETCGGPAQIHVSGTESGDWCLDHAPPRFGVQVAESKTFNVWLAEQERWLAERAAEGAPKLLPTWRVLSASAFHLGVRHARSQPRPTVPPGPQPTEAEIEAVWNASGVFRTGVDMSNEARLAALIVRLRRGEAV